MTTLALGEAERAFLEMLNQLGVRYMVVGMSAAIVQGVPGVTQDIDLWFERLDDPRIGQAVRASGGVWISGNFGMHPPAIGGPGMEDRFDIVTHAHGLQAFTIEYESAAVETIDGVPLRILPLERIIESKRSANRPKDRAQLPSLDATLAAIRKRTAGGPEGVR